MDGDQFPICKTRCETPALSFIRQRGITRWNNTKTTAKQHPKNTVFVTLIQISLIGSQIKHSLNLLFWVPFQNCGRIINAEGTEIDREIHKNHRGFDTSFAPRLPVTLAESGVANRMSVPVRLSKSAPDFSHEKKDARIIRKGRKKRKNSLPLDTAAENVHIITSVCVCAHVPLEISWDHLLPGENCRVTYYGVGENSHNAERYSAADPNSLSIFVGSFGIR